jgi:hypothetical protein
MIRISRRTATFAAVLAVLVGVDIFTAASCQAVTFIQWNSGPGNNGHYYGITDAASDWVAAESTAVSLGGHLASITSADEQSFIESTFLTGLFDTLPLWIGLADISPYGGGVGSTVYNNWTTGEAVSYTNWKAGEPNNFAPGEDYVTINWQRAVDLSSTKGTWNDTPLNGSTGFGGNSDGPYFGVVELVPEPSAVALLGGGGSLLLFAGLRRFRRKSKR